MLRFWTRLGALMVLVVVLVGLPLVVVMTVGVPAPSWEQLRRAWALRTLDDDTVVRIGATVFMTMWAWFAATAFGEFARVVRHRSSGRSLPAAQRGPAGWVKGVVRFVVLSSAAASLIGGVASHHASAVVRTPAGATSVSSSSDSTHTGASPVDTAEASPAEPVPASPGGSNGVSPLVSYLSGMGTALLLATGVVGTIESRRRQRWRTMRDGIAVMQRDPSLVHVEQTLRSVGGDEPLARLDAALRSIARDIARQRSKMLAAVLDADGSIRVVVDGDAHPSVPLWSWDQRAAEWWLPASVSLDQLAALAGDVVAPCPALVHIGTVDSGADLFVDVEAIGALSLQTPFADDVARALASSLALSPFMQGAHVVVSGVGLQPLTEGGTVASSVLAESAEEGVRIARRLLGTTLVNARSTSTFVLRVLGSAGESWEPAVVVSCCGSMPSNRIEAMPSSGLAVITDAQVDGGWVLDFRNDRHVLEPLGWLVRPVGIGHHDLADVVALVADSNAASVHHAQLPPPDELPPRCKEAAASWAPPSPVELARPEPVPFEEVPWTLMVRVLGPVSVTDREGVVVEFERSKSLELVVWLALHRDRPTRSAARTALWDLDVRAATFANVVSDARRGLARAVLPLEGDEWIARTMSEDLPLHPYVVTDAELLAARLEHARRLPDAAAIEVLRPGVEFLRALPLSGTNYLWSDAEGHTSALVVLAMSAATDLAERCLSVGDVDGVFWATGQGLKVLAGHEELIALRMRAHAGRGDLAGVRSEWASYERALAADTWSVPDPAPKLVSLRKALLG